MARFPKFTTPTYVPSDEGPAFAPTAVTLFSGVGSSSKALRDLGYDVLAHDFMPESVATLHSNGFDCIGGDVRQVDFTNPIYGSVRVIVGGPPCQPFSQGGRNAGQDDPRDMIPDFQRAVAQILPELFVLENVRGLAGPRHRDYLARRVSEFEAIGYHVEHQVLDFADYGTGQSRKRLIMIGRRVDLIDDFTSPVVWLRKLRHVKTMAEALDWTPQTCHERNLQAPAPAHDPEACLWPLVRPSTTVVGSFMPEVQAAPGYRSTGDGPRQNAPGSVVTTPEERLVLQGLPRDWKVQGAKTKRDLQIGNSVPCGPVRALIRANLGPATDRSMTHG